MEMVLPMNTMADPSAMRRSARRTPGSSTCEREASPVNATTARLSGMKATLLTRLRMKAVPQSFRSHTR
jgi:hypothetical protein